MKVLVLSPYAEFLEPTVVKGGDTCIVRHEYCEVSDWPGADWVVSFGYRKIIPERAITKFGGRIINIHCSALPFNRGAAPNFWAWFDGTPMGVTIHEVTATLDGGPILAQRRMFEGDFRSPPTLRTTYDDLLVAAAGLFASHWPVIRNEEHGAIFFGARADADGSSGSYHKAGDELPFFTRLTRGYDTPVNEVRNLGHIYRKTLR